MSQFKKGHRGAGFLTRNSSRHSQRNDSVSSNHS